MSDITPLCFAEGFVHQWEVMKQGCENALPSVRLSLRGTA